MADIMKINRPPLRDIPAMLRINAEKIERGEFGTVATMAAVAINESGMVTIFAWGDVISPLAIRGLLDCAASNLNPQVWRS